MYRLTKQISYVTIIELSICIVIITLMACNNTSNTTKTTKGSELAVEQASMRLYQDTRTAGYRLIYITEAQKRIEEESNILIIDTRTEVVFKKKHIPNAINIPAPLELDNPLLQRKYRERIESILPTDKFTPIIIYSDSVKDRRSHLTASILERLAYRYVYRMPGGFSAWIEKGYPTSQ